MSSCEERRKANIADNRRILAEIGLINPFKGLPSLIPKKKFPPPSFKKTAVKRKTVENLPRQEKRPRLEEVNIEQEYNGVRLTRRSARLHRKSKEEVSKEEPGDGSVFLSLDDDFDDDEQCGRKHVPVPKHRPNHFGAVPGIEIGASWLTRVECCRDGVHRPTVAGIHGSNEGAYSIALSGRYDDNVDYGDCFTYTGEGGRDLKGTSSNPKNLREAPQTKDQQLSRGNLALNISAETGNPVRVIRGYQLKNAFSPEEGYRYDGLYTVKKAWYGVGMAGFKVWRFALQRCPDQDPPPWEMEEEIENKENMDQDNVDEENKENMDEEQENVDTEKKKENMAEEQENVDKENKKVNIEHKNMDTENGLENVDQETKKETVGKEQENVDKESELENMDQENVEQENKIENVDKEKKNQEQGNADQGNKKENMEHENEPENVDKETMKETEEQQQENNEHGNELENVDQESELENVNEENKKENMDHKDELENVDQGNNDQENGLQKVVQKNKLESVDQEI